MPKASAREFHHKQNASRNKKALRAVSIRSGGLAPTAFGANSVASALGGLARRDPGSAVRTYHEGSDEPLKLGTFYLAESRNFLFGSDNRSAKGRSHLRGHSRYQSR